MVSPEQAASSPEITVSDEPTNPTVSYASAIVRQDDGSDVLVWMWQSTRNRTSGERLHGVFWSHGYVAKKPHLYESATLADGSAAELIPDERDGESHITTKCDVLTCKILELWVVFFDEAHVRAARSTGLVFTMHAKDGTTKTTTIPAALIDAVFRQIDVR
jgi:hypothetical protein